MALVAAAVALFAVISSSRETGSSASDAGERQVATATPATEQKPSSPARKRRVETYTVEPGDTPSSIAQEENVDLDALLAANPDADPAALSPGQELELP